MNASRIFVSPTRSVVSPRMHMRLAVPRFAMLLISCCEDAGALMQTRTRKCPESEDASCDLNRYVNLGECVCLRLLPCQGMSLDSETVFHLQN